MEKSRWKHSTQKIEKPLFSLKFSSEQGFTYVELVISMVLVTLLIPSLFLILYTAGTEAKKMMETQYLRMNWQAFTMQTQREWMMAHNVSLEDNQCVWRNPNDEKVRYIWKNHHMVRQVQSGNGKWTGYMIVLAEVKQAKIQCTDHLLIAEVILQKEKTSLPFRFVISPRKSASK